MKDIVEKINNMELPKDENSPVYECVKTMKLANERFKASKEDKT